MKFALHLLLSTAPAVAFHPSPQTFLVNHHNRHHEPSPRTVGHTCLYYKEPKPNADGSASADSSGSDNSSNVWSVLANTERWISDTLDRSNKAANARRDAAAEAERLKKQKEQEEESKMHFADEKGEEEQSSSLPPPKDNPYVRKEVSYVCETGNELAVVVGGIFRRIREARELGESHGRGVEARLGEYT